MMINDIVYRVRALFHRDAVDASVAEELNFHFEQQVSKYLNSGLTRDEAIRRTRLGFGGLDQVKEQCRDAWGVRLIEVLLQDVRYGLRLLWKNPSFTITAVLTLALGIGASTAVFSVVNGILLKPLPYKNPDRVVMLWWKAPLTSSQFNVEQFPWLLRDFINFWPMAKSFESVGAFKSDFFNLVGAGEPARLDGLRASSGFFSALGIAPALGRTFTIDEDRPGNGLKVILGDQVWRERFGADPKVLGNAIALNGLSYTVVGVMPRDFSFPHAEDMPNALPFPARIQLWVPLDLPATAVPGPSELAVVGRLKPDVTAQQAEAEMAVFGGAVEREFPQAKGWYNPSVVKLARQVVGDTRRPLLLLLCAVAVVLLIASSNVASLLLTRSLGRSQEFTLRGALGATRGRMIRQLLTESVVLAAIGGLAAILVAMIGVHFVKVFGPSNIPRLSEVGLDLNVFIFTILITLGTGLFFGLVPALGTKRENLVESLKEGGHRSGRSATQPRIRNALLVAQVALALVLVVSAGLLIRTFYHMLAADSGFNPSRVLTFQLSLPTPKFADTDQMALTYQKALRAVQSLPGVQMAGLVSEVPMGGSTDGTAIRVPDHPPLNDLDKDEPYANYSFASPGYFSAIGTPLLRGRDFTEADTADAMRVTVINSAMAAQYWPGQDPIGRQVGVKTRRWPTRTIVGIVANIKHSSLREPPYPEMYVPYTQNEIKIWPSMQTMQVALRAKGDPKNLTVSIREALHSVDPDLPVSSVATLETLVDDSMAQSRFSLFFVGSFGALALLLAMIGMYGVISYSVQQRTHEIGIRMAIGASRVHVLGMVMGLGARLAALGILLGLLAAWMVTRTMASFLYGVQPTDALTFSVVSAVLMGVALLSCYLPARRATRIDPLIALRYE